MQLAVGPMGDIFRLSRRVDGDALQMLRLQCEAVQGDAQAFLQPFSEPLAPVAHARTLMGKAMLKELFPCKILEIRIIYPAITDSFIGQAGDLLQKEKSDHIAGRHCGIACSAKQIGDPVVDTPPVNAISQLHQSMSHIDDLVQPGPEHIVSP